MAPRSAVIGAACLLLSAHAAWAACQVSARRTVPLEMAGGLMLVSVAVNGVPVPFLLDTGAERTVIGNQAAMALKVARDEWVSTDITGLGGNERERLGRPASLSLGGVALRRRTLVADNSVVVGTIASEMAGHPIAGLLGQDFLSVFDLDIDPAHGRLTLYDVAGCVGDFLPWREPYSGMQAIRLVRNILAVPVRVDGEQLTAELDSGAQRSVLLAPGVQRLDRRHLGPQPDGPEQLRGFGAGSAGARLQRFGAIQVGAETISDMTLLLTQARTLRSVDMLLGADWLSRRHVWISWATDQVLVGALLPGPRP